MIARLFSPHLPAAIRILLPLFIYACSNAPAGRGFPDPGAGPGDGTVIPNPTTPDAGPDNGYPPTDPPTGNALDSLRPTIEQLLAQAKLPGLSACVIKDAKVQQCAGFGLANIESNMAVTADTPFLLASVSKTITATAILRLWEAGEFKLDDPVNGTLQWNIDSPGGAPITYRQLLTHTSGIQDNWDIMEASFYFDDVDPTISLAELTEGYFRKTGKWYSEKNFLSSASGAAYEYSNMAIALLGYLGELHAGMDFAQYCNKTIFEKLKMNSTSWRIADYDPNKLAMPYGFVNGKFTAYGQYTFADYPDGGLRASAKDLARFLAAISAGGIIDGQRILQEATVAEMLREQISQIEAGQGLIWYQTDGVSTDEDWWGHEGAEEGVATMMAFRKEDGLGYVMLMNGDEPDQSGPIDQIRNKLIEVAESLGN